VPALLQKCTTTLTFNGNQKFGTISYDSGMDTVCPAGSYFDSAKNCPYCPVGYTCSGGDRIVPCPPSERLLWVGVEW